jgi:type III secretion protein D
MNGPVLTILDGLQAGSRTRLATGDTRIGSGVECAVVVADPVMQPDHFEIAVGDATALRALRPLLLLDGTALAAGSELVVTGPTSFMAGGTRFLLDVPPRPAAEVPAPRVRRHRRRGFAVGAVAVLAGLGGTAFWLGGGGVAPRTADAGPVQVPRPRPQPVNMDAAAAGLRQRLAEAGLGGLSVTLQPDGTLAATGLLPPSDQPAWNAARQWFDDRYGNGAVVVEQFSAPGSMPPLRVAAVWNGAHPYVVDDHGDRFRAGAAIGDGWIIDHIEEGRIVVRRGAQTVALRY